MPHAQCRPEVSRKARTLPKFAEQNKYVCAHGKSVKVRRLLFLDVLDHLRPPLLPVLYAINPAKSGGSKMRLFMPGNVRIWHKILKIVKHTHKKTF